MKRFSYREYVSVKKYLEEVCDSFGAGLERDDCLGEAWVTYWSARKSYSAYEGCCDWETYLEFQIEDCLNQLRMARNRRIELESQLSMDQRIADSNETVGSTFFYHQGDFTKGTALWDFIDRLGSLKKNIASRMVDGEADHEIMESLSISDAQYYRIKCELREDMTQYLVI